MSESPYILTDDYLRWNPQGFPAFRPVVEGNGPVRYQWRFNGAPLADETNCLLRFASLDPNNAGPYHIESVNSAGTTTSLFTQLRVPFIPSFASVQKAGGSSTDSGRSLALDGNGNVFISGSFIGAAMFGTTNLSATGTNEYADAFLAKYDRDSNFLWARPLTGSLGRRSAFCVRTDPAGNVYVGGVFEGTTTIGSTTLSSAGGLDIFLAKFDNNGGFLWARSGGGPGTDVIGGGMVDTNGKISPPGSFGGMSVDTNGNVYLPGTFEGVANISGVALTSAGGADALLAKYNRNGDLVWVVRAGGTNDDYGAGTTVDSAGNPFLVGSITGPVEFQGIQFNTYGSMDHFVARYTPTGDLVWVRHNGGPGQAARANSVCVDNLGRVLVTGQYVVTNLPANFQGFASAWDVGNGDYLGGVYLSATRNLIGQAIRADREGNFYMAGCFRDWLQLGKTVVQGQGNWDGFVIKFSFIGNPIWIQTLGGPGDDFVNAMELDPLGAIHLAGSFQRTARFNPSSLNSVGDSDIWFGKLNSLAAPDLTIRRESDSVELTWPMTAGDLSFQSSPSLSSTSQWAGLVYYYRSGNSNRAVQVITNRTAFFRLQ